MTFFLKMTAKMKKCSFQFHMLPEILFISFLGVACGLVSLELLVGSLCPEVEEANLETTRRVRGQNRESKKLKHQ